MYPLIPYKRFTIRTNLSCDQAMDILRQSVQSRTSRFSTPPPGARFEGTLWADRFRIKRVIRYRNSFLPILHGRFVAAGHETVVDVTMVMQPAVIGILLLFCGGGVIGIAKAVSDFARAGELDYRFGIPFFMFAFLYFLTFVGFGSEAEKAQIMLEQVFNSSGGGT